MLTLLFATAALAQEGCTIKNDTASLDQVVSEAESAFTDLDVDGFHGKVDELALMLACASEPVTPALAAEVHRLRGIQQFTADDEKRAELSLIAAHEVSGGEALPEQLVPAGHPIRRLYGPSTDASHEEVPPPADGELRFDGKKGLERPTDRASLLQLLDASGAPTTTVYLYPDDILPRYAAAEVAEPAASMPVAAIVGGALVIGGLGSLAVAQGHKSDLLSADTQAEMDLHRGPNKTFGLLGYGLVGAGLAGVGVQLAL